MQDQENKCVENVPRSQDRRKVMQKIATGVGLLAGYTVLPEKWIRPVVGQIVLPAHAETSGPVLTAHNVSEVYTLRSFAGNDKRFTWLNETGANYGGPVKFVFSNGCGELIVPDAAVTYGADGTTSNHNQAFYFCGTDFPVGSPENSLNRASVFAPPGCPAATVTMYYSR